MMRGDVAVAGDIAGTSSNSGGKNEKSGIVIASGEGNHLQTNPRVRAYD